MAMSMILLLSLIGLCSCRLLLPLACQPNPQWRNTPSYSISDRQFLTPTRYNFSMIVDAKDGSVSNFIRNSGTWQTHYIYAMAYFMKEGSHVLNLGPQSGLQILVMGTLIGPKGHLYIFQPYSFSYKMIRKNIFINNFEDMTSLYNVAAGESRSKATITIDYSNTGGSEVVVEGKTPTPSPVHEREEVLVDTVDSVLGDDVILDFALLDVEKFEVEALTGMKKIITRSKDRLVIMAEWQYNLNPRKNAKKASQLIDFFTSLEYGIYVYSGGFCTVGKFTKVNGFAELSGPNFYQLRDIFFVPKNVKLP